jgi:hypothetical protein
MSHHTHHESGGHSHPPAGRKLHQDWRFIVAVVLMLIAMVVYVLTLDEAVVPVVVPAGDAAATSGAPGNP